MKKMLFIGILLLLSAQFLVSAKAAGQAVIVSHTGYIDAAGHYHVIGEVKNAGDGALRFVNITATFYDSKGVIVTTSFGFTMIRILHAGQKSPFDIVLLDKGRSAKVDHYELGITYRQSESLPMGLQVLSHSKYKDASGWLHIVGEIKNIGDRDVDFVWVVATFYDSSGKVVGLSFAFLDLKGLAAGQKAPFEIILLNKEQSNLTATYALEAQSQEYNVIAEFPAGTLVLAVVILLAVAILKVRLLQKGEPLQRGALRFCEEQLLEAETSVVLGSFLGDKSISNTLTYTQLISFERDEQSSGAGRTLSEARKLA